MTTTTTTRSGIELAELVTRCEQGDSQAWAQLIEDYERLVRFIARGFRLNDAEVSDVTQVVWMRLFEKISTIRNKAAVKAWLVTTTRNEALRVARKSAKSVALDWDITEVATPSALEGIIVSEENAAMLRAYNHLSGTDQRVLAVLVLDEDMTYINASTILERPVGSLGPTRSRALARLRELFDAEMGEAQAA